MTNDPTDWLATYQAEQQKRQAHLPVLKDALLDALSRHDISTVAVDYHGESDSGQINGIAAFDGTDSSVKLPEALDKQIEEFAWELLDVYHAGFEDNDGGYG